MRKYEFEKILKNVEKPGRYIGGELNSTEKDFHAQDVTFCFAFPDLYEVGMSHLGMHILYQLINSVDGFICERAFAPWPDMEKEMRKADIKLYSLENKIELNKFDILGFTLQYEMSYTNILNMLDLAGIELFSKNRNENNPLIIAGGPCAYNPEVIADFIDIFILGEGEEVNLELMKLYRQHKSRGYNKFEFLKAASQIEGIYIPQFYEVEYDELDRIKSFQPKYSFAPRTIKKRYIKDLDKLYYPDKMIVPFIETVHDRAVLEIFRGCTQGCRFCQAGMIYRPIREKSVNLLISQSEKLIDSTGYQDISLSSLSSCDYSSIGSLAESLIDKYDDSKIGVSLPSLRLDTFSLDLLKKIEKVRKSGLTFAPEAGTQRMRNVINKNITQDNLFQTAKNAFDRGWSRLKLYFMVGLPTETIDDVYGIKDLAYEVKRIFFDRPKDMIKGNFTLTVSTSCFVPKPFTPYQWYKQNSIEEFYEKIYALKNIIKDPKIKYQYHDPELSFMEGIIGRGNRKVSKIIYRAWKNGAIFDGWSDFFDYDIWKEAIEIEGFKIENLNRQMEFDEILPWDFIDIGVKKSYLIEEYKKSIMAENTKDCRFKCHQCGIENCEMWRVHPWKK